MSYSVEGHGASNERGAMNNRYTQGSGRRGECREQLELRGRAVRLMRAALARLDRPWYELPRSTADWDILLY